MVRVYNDNSALRSLFRGGFSLSGRFNAETFDDRTVAASEMSDSERSNIGQVSAVGLRPYTLEEKLQSLKRLIAKRDIALTAQVTMDAIRAEMQKPENDGLGVRQMAAVLKDKKLLRAVMAPQNVLKVPQLLMAMR